MLENLNSIHGALLRMNRSIRAEGAFGTVKWNRSYTRLRRRGLEGVILEIALVSSGFNLHKYHLKQLQRREAALNYKKIPSEFLKNPKGFGCCTNFDRKIKKMIKSNAEIPNWNLCIFRRVVFVQALSFYSFNIVSGFLYTKNGVTPFLRLHHHS